MIIDPINFDDEPEGPHTFPCACGVDTCLGWDDDPQNINVGRGQWYAADCRHKPLAITEDQDRAFKDDGARGK